VAVDISRDSSCSFGGVNSKKMQTVLVKIGQGGGFGQEHLFVPRGCSGTVQKGGM